MADTGAKTGAYAGEAGLQAGMAGHTVQDALRVGQQFLRAAGIDDDGSDARRLLLAVLGLTALDLVRAPDTRVDAQAAAAFADMLHRRAAREPVARIIGWRGFYGREFRVTAATLDPRPDTETLIDAALALVRESGLDRAPFTVADVGTGTGCIVLTLLAELPMATGVGIDPSRDALTVAADNARRLGLESRVRWCEARGLGDTQGPIALVVSNPPYIPHGAIAALAPEVRQHDPHLALDGGPDGLDIYREIAAGLRPRATGGWAIFEVGRGQACDVAELLRQCYPLENDFRSFKDLAGIERCVAISTQFGGKVKKDLGFPAGRR